MSTHEDLVAHLAAKDPATRTRTLDGFDGKNALVYWVPPSIDT